MESYRDSALGAASARRRGFSRAGFVLRPVRIADETRYRLCVGPFPDLEGAVAVRDSLLDQAGAAYCLVYVDSAP